MGKAGGWGLTRMAYSGDALRPYRWVHFWRSWDHVRKVTLRNVRFRKFSIFENFRQIYNLPISKQKYFPQGYQNAQLNTSYPTKFILFPFFRLHLLFLFPLSWWFSSRIRFTNYEPRCYPNLRFNLSLGKQLVRDCNTKLWNMNQNVLQI